MMRHRESVIPAESITTTRNPTSSDGSTISRINTASPISSVRRWASRRTKPEEEPQDAFVNWDEFPETKGARSDVEAKLSNQRSLGLTWNDLSVRTRSTELAFAETVASQFVPPFLRRKHEAGVAPVQTILDRSSGCVKPGEMLLVLGRPGLDARRCSRFWLIAEMGTMKWKAK